MTGPGGAGRALRAALSGGEDYELLLAVPPDRVAAALRAASGVGVPLTEVGRLARGRGVKVVDGWGRPLPVVSGGHDHLR